MRPGPGSGGGGALWRSIFGEKVLRRLPQACRASHVLGNLAEAKNQGCGGQAREVAAVARSGALISEKSVLPTPSCLQDLSWSCSWESGSGLGPRMRPGADSSGGGSLWRTIFGEKCSDDPLRPIERVLVMLWESGSGLRPRMQPGAGSGGGRAL